VEPAPRNAVVLARLSDLRDDDERGVDGQVADGHDYARRIGCGIGPRLSHIAFAQVAVRTAGISSGAASCHEAGRGRAPSRARPGAALGSRVAVEQLRLHVNVLQVHRDGRAVPTLDQQGEVVKLLGLQPEDSAMTRPAPPGARYAAQLAGRGLTDRQR